MCAKQRRVSSSKRPRTAAEWRALAAELAEQAERMWDDEAIDPTKAASVSKRGLRALAIAEAMDDVGDNQALTPPPLPASKKQRSLLDVNTPQPQEKKETQRRRAADKATQRVGRPTEVDHVFSRALAKADSNVARWARDHGLTRQTVQNWILRDSFPNYRADQIETELGIKVNRSKKH